MGVEGLLSVVRPLREQFEYGVVNPDLDDDFQYNYFLFDGSSWLWNVMKGNILMDFGYIRRRAKGMIRRFRLCGFKLIVFIDANITNDKLDTWLSRRAQRVETLYAINHRIKSSKGSIQGFKHIWFAPCGAYFFCGQVFESLGCKVIYAHIDCDREMFGYYQTNKSYQNINGIIGFDTDFLIFDFPIYLELPSMRFQSDSQMLTFQGYQHHRLLNRLRCKQRHLSRVASIMGCDVTNRLQSCGGSIDYAVRIVKDTEIVSQNTQKKVRKAKNGRKKVQNKGYFFESYGGMKKRFRVSDTFYSGIVPLDILPHPYLIMLLFQDYNERADVVTVNAHKQNKLNKERSPYHYIKGLIMDMAMDDADLIKNHRETSSIITLQLRKWLYRSLLSDFGNECKETKDSAFDRMLQEKELRMKEVICYAAPRLCFKEDSTKREWLKGINVDILSADEDKINPLYNLESYKFVKNVLENDAKSEDSEDSEEDDEDIFTIEIPQEYMIRDMIYLLNYLHDLDRNRTKKKQTEEECKEDKDGKKVEQSNVESKENKVEHNDDKEKEQIPFVFGTINTENDDILETNVVETETNATSDTNVCSAKKTKKDKKRKRGKRGNRKKNHRKKPNHSQLQNVSKETKRKEEIKNDKVNKKKKKTKNVKHGLTTWNELKLLKNTFLFQWKYRDIFICVDENTNDKKHKHAEFESHYLKINARSMHLRSILHNVYEVIFVFLHMQFKCQWFGRYFSDFLRHHYNEKHNENMEHETESNAFENIPKLQLLNEVQCEFNEDCECICNNCKINDKIESWKENVTNACDDMQIDIQIPYVWDLLNTRVFHWIWAHYGKTKKWIKECRPEDTLE